MARAGALPPSSAATHPLGARWAAGVALASEGLDFGAEGDQRRHPFLGWCADVRGVASPVVPAAAFGVEAKDDHLSTLLRVELQGLALAFGVLLTDAEQHLRLGQP